MRGARSGSVKPTGDGRVSYIPGSIAQGNHLHLRERARALHPPGPERAAFIARGGLPVAAKRSRRKAAPTT